MSGSSCRSKARVILCSGMFRVCTGQQLDPTHDLNQLSKSAGNSHGGPPLATFRASDFFIFFSTHTAHTRWWQRETGFTCLTSIALIIHRHVRQLNLNPISTGWGGAGRANNYFNNPQTTHTENKKVFTNLVQSLANRVTATHATL